MLRELRGRGGPDSPSRQLLSPTPGAVLRSPPHQSGGQPTSSGVPGDHNSGINRQESTLAAQGRGYGRGDGSRTTRDAG